MKPHCFFLKINIRRVEYNARIWNAKLLNHTEFSIYNAKLLSEYRHSICICHRKLLEKRGSKMTFKIITVIKKKKIYQIYSSYTYETGKMAPSNLADSDTYWVGNSSLHFDIQDDMLLKLESSESERSSYYVLRV